MIWHRFCSKSERCLLPLMENSATEHLQFILFHQLIMYIVGGSIYLWSFVRCEKWLLLNCMMTIPSPQTSQSPFSWDRTLTNINSYVKCPIVALWWTGTISYFNGCALWLTVADGDESGARSQTTQASLTTDTFCAREHSLPLFMTRDNSWSATEHQGSVVCQIYLLNR
jgi:hypothetical protein